MNHNHIDSLHAAHSPSSYITSAHTPSISIAHLLGFSDIATPELQLSALGCLTHYHNQSINQSISESKLMPAKLGPIASPQSQVSPHTTMPAISIYMCLDVKEYKSSFKTQQATGIDV